jgi:hypothetical protein
VIVYVSIGNSDDKLTQSEWNDFIRSVDAALMAVAHIHGAWFSAPVSPWQNACWCIEAPEGRADFTSLKDALCDLARKYRQDSIAWAPVIHTEMLG